MANRELGRLVRLWSGRGAAGCLVAATCLYVPTQAVAANLPPAEKVFERYAEAIGGAAVGKIKSMAAEFDFSMPSQGLLTTGREYFIHPDKHYLAIDLAASGIPDFESAVIGDVAWQRHPTFGTRLLDGEEKRQALRQVPIDSFAGWKRHYTKAETVAEEEVGGKTCYKVVLTPAEGETLTTHFDKATGLLVQEALKEPTMGLMIVTKYDDYRAVEGVQIAHRIEQQGGEGFVVELTSVRVNVTDIPQEKLALPESLRTPTPSTP
jgi:hypothetical protein